MKWMAQPGDPDLRGQRVTLDGPMLSPKPWPLSPAPTPRTASHTRSGWVLNRGLTCLGLNLSLFYNVLWRRGWDSNPRYACTHNGFRDRPDRPLRHLSVVLRPRL